MFLMFESMDTSVSVVPLRFPNVAFALEVLGPQSGSISMTHSGQNEYDKSVFSTVYNTL